MSGRGKGVRTRRNRVTPYANSAISDRQWDLNNPSNWTSQKFREELDKKGIKTPSSLPKSVLKQLYIENSNTSGITTPQIQQNRTISDNDTSNPLSTEPEVAVTDSGTNVQPLASLDINYIPVPNTSLAEQDTMSVNHQVTSSNTGGITNDIPMQNSNFNSMATMSTMLAHCFSGFQQSLNHFNQNLNKGTNTDSSGFNLQQWYKAQSSTTNHMDQVPNIPIFQTGLQQDLIYPSPTVQQLDARDSSTQHGFQGVRSDSFSNVDIISPILQKQIIEGKDINLASLLIPKYECPQTNNILANGIELNVSGKPDPRLNRKLSLQEFIRAFGKFKRVMTTVFPDRRAELDAYQDDIIDICNFFGDKFYDYHKMFSAKAATLLREKFVKIDWSKRDRDILNLVTAGASINICNICNMADHTTAFCSLQTSGNYQSHFNKNSRQFEASIDSGPSSDKLDKNGRTRVYFKGEEVCNNFNTARGCTRINCSYRHVCSKCNLSNHSLPNCRVSNKGGEQNSLAKPLLPISSQNSGKHFKK